MKLKDILKNIEIVECSADVEAKAGGLCFDSRIAKAGDVFFAVRGFASDGHKYISSAAQKGALCAVCEEPPQCDIPYVIVKDSRRALGEASCNWFEHPSKQLKVVGVTGTNGKTTVTNLIKRIIEKTTGQKAGLIGTNKNMIGDRDIPAERTTPDSYELQKLLREMVEEGCGYAVMEVSSHALALDRVHGIDFAVGVFTNLTEDHLDFHKTMENYAAAKAELFTMSEYAVINIDDNAAEIMKKSAKGNIISYSLDKNEAEITAKDIKLSPKGISFCALSTGILEKVRLGTPGMFSVYNALAALGASVALGLPLRDAAEALDGTTGVKGRVELVPTDSDFSIIIDYAHTPDALENILDTVRQFTEGRLVLVFGCGGDREHEKRSIMGKIAAEKADIIYITSDNPRTEHPFGIIRQILEGMKDTKTPYKVIENRKTAIESAIEEARPGDVILLAGKGHETYQIIGREKFHFDEREICADFLGRKN